MPSITERIVTYNHGRIPERLAYKYRLLAESAFRFFRGTCHLFYEDWHLHLHHVPAVWICGDLHAENFGSYKGNNRLVYFDINDFDEAVLAPCTFELARFVTSVFLVAEQLGLTLNQSRSLASSCIERYAQALVYGKALYIERDTAHGMVQDLMSHVQEERRENFLNKRTEICKSTRDNSTKGTKDTRRFVHDGKRYEPCSPEQRATVERLIADFAKQPKATNAFIATLYDKHFLKPEFYTVIDAAQRIAGTGSLGVERYVVLVEGKGSPNKNFMIDLKAATSSAVMPALRGLGIQQPAWNSEAERCVAIQRRMQAISPALMAALVDTTTGTSFIMRELQPTQDKVDFRTAKGSIERVEEVLLIMAQVLAWAELRSSGRQGSARADELIAFGEDVERWSKPVLEYAQEYAVQAEHDWKAFLAEHP
jgi:uncharacterized protein (DUF2252 family)